jgi:hypothetical protein
MEKARSDMVVLEDFLNLHQGDLQKLVSGKSEDLLEVVQGYSNKFETLAGQLDGQLDKL